MSESFLSWEKGNPVQETHRSVRLLMKDEEAASVQSVYVSQSCQLRMTFYSPCLI